MGPKTNRPEFRRLFLNQRPMESWKKLQNSPVEFVEGKENEFGFTAPVKMMEERLMVSLPYDIVPGSCRSMGKAGIDPDLRTSQNPAPRFSS